jgi:multidrug efflux pump subunit AcrA (membrane-fusion protein)
MHPFLYQISHPWHWLNYGQNGIILAAALSLFVSGLSVYVLLKSLQAVKQQALAADRQAEAAEEQAKAARAGAQLARAQLREATRDRRLAKRRKQTDAAVLEALSSGRDWAGSGHPMTGAGFIAVKPNEIAEHLGMLVSAVQSSLRRLRAVDKVAKSGETSYWFVLS